MARKQASSSQQLTAERVLTINMSEELRKARIGDKTAAREVMRFLHDYLTHSLPFTGIHSGFREYREYLLDALRAGADGESIDAKLGLKSRGRPSVPWQAKLLVTNVVQQWMEQGGEDGGHLTLEKAIPKACNQINKFLKSGAQHECSDGRKADSAWAALRIKHVTEANASDWYTEVLSYLRKGGI